MYVNHLHRGASMSEVVTYWTPNMYIPDWDPRRETVLCLPKSDFPLYASTML